ncbi:hypothetical protein CEE45_15130 [Candidatus Heimdallarchaeota archaeon B3_Heim]|nr:MAG: hypothetical protein CEE45_15130 [Candidatus Heimdallarchaeota archaeon B3_Heim]
MKRKHLISGLIILGLVAVVATTVVVNGSVISDTLNGTRDGTCDGLGPHGQTGNGNHGGNGPMDGTGNQWGSQGPHGDGTCNQTSIIDG